MCAGTKRRSFLTGVRGNEAAFVTYWCARERSGVRSLQFKPDVVDGRKGAAVDRSGTVFKEGGEVFGSAIAFVLGKAIRVVTFHQIRT